jgi:hypothetical protein
MKNACYIPSLYVFQSRSSLLRVLWLAKLARRFFAGTAVGSVHFLELVGTKTTAEN